MYGCFILDTAVLWEHSFQMRCSSLVVCFLHTKRRAVVRGGEKGSYKRTRSLALAPECPSSKHCCFVSFWHTKPNTVTVPLSQSRTRDTPSRVPPGTLLAPTLCMAGSLMCSLPSLHSFLREGSPTSSIWSGDLPSCCSPAPQLACFPQGIYHNLSLTNSSAYFLFLCFSQ